MGLHKPMKALRWYISAAEHTRVCTCPVSKFN